MPVLCVIVILSTVAVVIVIVVYHMIRRHHKMTVSSSESANEWYVGPRHEQVATHTQEIYDNPQVDSARFIQSEQNIAYAIL